MGTFAPFMISKDLLLALAPVSLIFPCLKSLVTDRTWGVSPLWFRPCFTTVIRRTVCFLVSGCLRELFALVTFTFPRSNISLSVPLDIDMLFSTEYIADLRGFLTSAMASPIGGRQFPGEIFSNDIHIRPFNVSYCYREVKPLILMQK